MPRVARIKAPNSMYHIMVRSISEIELFKEDDDKIKYFSLIKKYQYKYGFKVYSYCLMGNHGHLLIDCLGSDISKIMHAINFCYAQYYNRKYKRRGPVFQDRFKSKPVDNKRYFITLTAYIHNNPKDIPEYKDNVSEYPFSSLKEYLHDTDTFYILSQDVLKTLINYKNQKNRERYIRLVGISNCEKIEHDVEFINEKTHYKSEKNIIIRDKTPRKIINYVANYLGINPLTIHIKHKQSYTKIRAISCFLMGGFCNITQKEICSIIGNITQSRVSRLSNLGLKYILEDKVLLEKYLML